jgi:4-hydroxy-tetrahydrodipicolinate synthase
MYLPHGVIPAVLLPFNLDFSIDEESYRSHLRDVGSVEGVTAVTTNAHASEVATCTFDEQRRVLDITTDEVGSRLAVISGIYADGSFQAQRLAKMATEGGASALLVFPSGIFAHGQRPEMAVEHFRRIADVTDLPLIIFQYPLATGQGYPLQTLLQIVEAVPTVCAIKDWSANPQLHERQVRALQSLPRPISVLTTHSAWLLGSLILGCKGLLSGSGSVIADLQAQLFRAVQDKDLARAQRVSDRIFPTAEIFYSEPWVDMHNRMKEALVLLGKLPLAVVRPPLMKLSSAEVQKIRLALEHAGLFA